MTKPTGNGTPPPKLKSVQILFALLAATLIFAALAPLLQGDKTSSATISYSEFLRRLEAGSFDTVVIEDSKLSGILKDQTDRPLITYAPAIPDPSFMERLRASRVEIVTKPPAEDSRLLSWLPMILIFGFWFWMISRMGRFRGRFPGGEDGFLGGVGKQKPGSRPDVRFADVAGQDQAKREVIELIEFLQDPDRFSRVGATVPRGVLLMGPPGTGKTLLAKALAGEAGVPFFSTSASEFIEVFVGVGAARVRRMFEEAKNHAPSVVFIDELDSIGRTRGAGLGGGHDEREQTLNQILAELDGFTGREGVVVIAATNRPDILDTALLRPGRFDRHVTLTLPDKDARRAILEVHVKGVPLARDVDLDTVSAGTPGFSGADLKNLVNEAAIMAARESRRDVPMSCFDLARDKVMLGTVRTLAIRPDERHRLAVHEAGHTVVAWHVPEADTLYKVTIIPRGQSLGGTHLLPQDERHTMPEDYLRAQLAVLLGGRAAEKLFLGSVSSGADDDIRRATALARQMVSRWGMSPEIGPMDLRDSEDHPFLGREIAQPRNASEAMTAEVDKAVKALLVEAEAVAIQALEADRPGAERLISRLEAEETLDHTDVEECLGPDAATNPGADQTAISSE